MRDILGWLDQNTAWVFSGIGIAIPIAVIGWWISRRSASRHQVQQSPIGSGNISVSIVAPSQAPVQTHSAPALVPARSQRNFIELVSPHSRVCLAYRRRWEDGDGLSETYRKYMESPIIVTLGRFSGNAEIVRAQIVYLDSARKELLKVHGTWLEADYAYITPIVGVDYEIVLAGQFATDAWRAFDDKRTRQADNRELTIRPLLIKEHGISFAKVLTFVGDEKGPEFLFNLTFKADGCLASRWPA